MSMGSASKDFEVTAALLLDLLDRDKSATWLYLLLDVVETWARGCVKVVYYLRT
jgi:hypothetical protein